MVSAHERAPREIREFCGLVTDGLKGQLPSLQTNAAAHMCSIGKPTFGYVYHRRDSLLIYLRCPEADGSVLAGLIRPAEALAIDKRKTLGTPWADMTPYFVKISTREAATAAIPLLLYAARQRKRTNVLVLPSEEYAAERFEGERVAVYVNRYERDPKARAECVKIFGAVCAVCGLDFGKAYGEIGRGFIHVHHLNPLSVIGKKHKVNPRNDLRPVCPNCHEMLHRKSPPFSIDELKAKVAT